MSGGGAVGSGLGALAGLALGPESGGLSMLIPAATGAAGGFLGGKITGNRNPLLDALMGGIGGGLGGASGLGDTLGIGNSAGFFGAAPAAEGIDSLDAAAGAALDGTEGELYGAAPTVGAVTGAAPAAAANGSGVMGYLGKQNPLSLALAGTTGLSAIQSLLPHPQVNTAKNAANVIGTNPNFNGGLPKYTMQSTSSPYQGNWYTYGETPQTPLYNARPIPVMKQGGMAHYAKGGSVHGYAMGGAPIMPQGMPAQNPVSMPQQSTPINPLALKAAHNVGIAIGQHLRSRMKTPAGQVHGQGGGQDDAVPARLSEGEYIIPADIVSGLGDGSSNAGSRKLDNMVHHVRAHKATKSFPPKAHNPLSYMNKGAA